MNHVITPSLPLRHSAWPIAAAGMWLGLLLCTAAPAGATPPLAPAPATAAPARAYAEIPFVVKGLNVRGASVFDSQELLRFAHALHSQQGRVPTAQGMADAIALMYREDGYFLAEVEWQADPADGSLTWHVREGWLADVTVVGMDARGQRHTQAYFDSLRSAGPLHRDAFERALALAGDQAGVSLRARFVPQPNADGFALMLEAEQARRSGSLTLDVVPVRPGHSRRLHWQEERYGLWRSGDLLRLQASATRDPRDASGRNGDSLVGAFQYRTALGSEGDYVEVLAGDARSQQGLSLTASRSELDGRHASVAWGRAFERDLHRWSYVIGAVESLRARASEGPSTLARSEAHALRLYLVRGQTDTGDDSMWQYALSASAGQRPSPAAGDLADGARRYGLLRAGFGWSGTSDRLGDIWSYRWEAAVQWTSQRLPRVERFLLGHYPYLRGYSPAEVSGDRGGAFTLEWTRQGSAQDGVAPARPFVFFSAGHVGQARVEASPPPSSWTLASVGVGLRYRPHTRVAVEAWLAHPLRSGPVSPRGSTTAYMSVGVSI